MANDGEAPKVDEQLYSRQLYVLGAETMQKMTQAHILLVGLGGAGCEIAKNLVLSGVGGLTIYDGEKVSSTDLGSFFYASEADIGKNRVDAALAKIAELNHYVNVNKFEGELTDDKLKQFSVVVFNDSLLTTPRMRATAKFCHANGVKIVSVESRGLSGLIFCDFGEKFFIGDTDGEEAPLCLVTGITAANPAVVTVHDDNRHNLEEGRKIIITDLEGGLGCLNEKELVVKEVTGPYQFTVDVDTSAMAPYDKGGYVKAQKQTAVVDYLSLDEALAAPEFIVTDFCKFETPAQLHFFYQALHSFVEKEGRFPKSYNAADATAILALAKEAHGGSEESKKIAEELNEELLQKLSFTCGGNLSPMAAFLGGMAAQEALKGCTGKFTPVKQFFYFDALECIPTNPPTEADCAPKGDRYDGQVAIFGRAFQEYMLSRQNFLVGAGALGCEFLKNFAMMGMGCGEGGQVIVTDMDTIEKSNLSRQFLFRNHHIGLPKSETAAAAAKAMNPGMNIRALVDKVAPDTEPVFNDRFWHGIDLVTNALDNVPARLYVDQKCIFYRKPLMESGTLGTQGNVQVVCPFKTESYGSSRDPPEKSIPICTLKNFPNAIEHTVQWGRDAFEGLFSTGPGDVHSYLTREEFLKSLDREPGNKLGALNNLMESLVTDKPSSFADCIRWGRFKFEDYFNHSIQQLLHNFPKDATTNTGAAFWSGPKRAPDAIPFDAKNPTHAAFVRSAACLRAFNFGISQEEGANIDAVAARAAEIEVPAFKPKQTVIQTEENQKVEQPEPDSNDIGQLEARLPKPSDMGGLTISPIEFEKDDDTNHHMEFIAATCNIRAENYKIPTADFAKVKKIAGRIIPAMVTTTSLVTGLVCMEQYKLVDNAMCEGKRPNDTFKNAFLNIALPFCTLSEPVPPAKAKYADVEFSLWDRFDIDEGRDILLKELVDFFEEKHNLEVSMLTCGAAILYSSFTNPAVAKKRLQMKMSDLYKEVTKTEEIPDGQMFLTFEICAAIDDEDVEVPSIRYRFKF